MDEIALLQQVVDHLQVLIDIASFYLGVFFALIVAVTWKG